MKLLQIAHKTAAILLLCLVTSVAEAQVTVEARIDSVNLFIGEQTDISLDVTFGAKQKLTLPALKKGTELVPNVEVLNVSSPDTTFLNDGKTLEVVQKYTVTAWDSALYYLPPFVVEVDGQRYESKSLALNVYTVDIDTLHTDRFFPSNDVMAPPFAWDDWRAIVGGAFLVTLLFIVSYVLFDRAQIGRAHV